MTFVQLLFSLILAVRLEASDPFTYEYSGQTQANGKAWIIVQINEDMKDVEITVTGDGQTVSRTPGNLKSGSRYKVEWKQKNGQARYELAIRARARDGDREGSFAFEVIKTAAKGKVGKLKVKSSRDDIVHRNKAEYESSFQLARYEYKVYDSDGDVIAAGEKDEANVAPGGTFTISWPPDEVFMIWVRGEDEFGRFTEYKLVPWAVEIPHTEINFDSGKWDVKNDEAPKLDEAVAVAFHELIALEKVNDAVGANLTPQLYIVGYTDTVGPTASNDKLSRNRAKQIAEYFKDQGFWAEIHYNGLGERALRVETGDNVDEVRNRRALYLIGVQQPPGGGQIPHSWKKLVGPRSKPAGFTPPPLPEKWKNYREERRAKAMAGQGGEASGDDDDDDDNPSANLEGWNEDVDPDELGVVGVGSDPETNGPPPVEGEPGATKKGCRISPDATPAPLGLAALTLLALVRRREDG